MLPFCGYHMGDYFKHWLRMGGKVPTERQPRIFHVNWFRKSADGKFLWPGFGENCRVLKWIFERCEGDGKAARTAIGYVPTAGAIDTAGLDGFSDGAMDELLAVDAAGWRDELQRVESHYGKFGDRLPAELRAELGALRERLG
jgi:phosphoenolpyruvate carboxykinase (GTP)